MTIKNGQLILLITLIGCISNSCVETFDFETEVETFESALVIEATITNELKSQEILLSRTFALDEDGPSPENNANVKVIDGVQNEYLFHETDPGVYISNTAFSVQPNRNYTLQIITNNGRSYASQPTQLTKNTHIDNLYPLRSFNDDGVEGMSIFVDSFDPTGNSNYYRYTYEETYKIIAPLYDSLEIVFQEGSFFDHDLILRPEQEKICYGTTKSNTIIITSTIGFVEDRIDQFRVRFISRDNYIMSYRYSILVKQHVQSREAYTFYETLKDFSESESLFSENQTGFISGNVFSVANQQEKVLGFFDVSFLDAHRVYFNYEDYFPGEVLPPYAIGCNGFVAPLVETLGGGHPLFDHIVQGFQFFGFNPGSDDDFVFGDGPYVLVTRACGDCTALGSNVVPDFWIE